MTDRLLATGTYPYSIAIGDFNGDGKQDLAVTGGVGTVTTLLGNGDGTFTPTSSSPAAGYAPDSIAIGDFNGDGIQDLAVANLTGDTVTILLGNGDGTFTPAAARLATGIYPVSIVVGDFNGDGIPDLAVANDSSNTVTILLGNGDGTFTAAPVSPATGSEPNSITVGDFNGDGIPDLAVASEGSFTVTILLGNGDGTFTPTTASLATVTYSDSITVGDFNGDGIPDLAVLNEGSDTVSILLGKGDGTFIPTAMSLATGGYYNSIAVGDFNGDGIPDLAVLNESNTVSIQTAQRTQTATATVTGISPVGSYGHLVDANYLGNSFYKSSLSSTTRLLIQPAITWATPAAISYGTALGATQLDATSPVAGSFSYLPAAGTVLGVGPQTLKATFTPTDTTDYATTSASVPLNVTQVTPSITWQTPAAISYGTALTATQLDATSPVAGSFSYSPVAGTILGVGAQTLKATFTPTDTTDYATTSASVPLNVTQATPAIALLTSASTAILTNAVTFTANVTSSAGTPSGTVSFYDGTTLLGFGTLASGVATYTTSGLAANAHTISAVYSGDTLFSTITSGLLAETVEDFTIAPASGSGSATASSAGRATYTLSFTPTIGTTFVGVISFAVSGLPSGATATFSPATLPANSAANSVTLTVTLPSQAAALPASNPFRSGSLPAALGVILLPFAVKRNTLRQNGALRGLKRIGRLTLLSIAIVWVAALSGCGGGQPAPGPTAQTYSLTVTATSGSLSHSTTVNLIVQ
jgi:hypothetical protein